MMKLSTHFAIIQLLKSGKIASPLCVVQAPDSFELNAGNFE